jgi:uncharacterized alpha/beta hydrolase family protein
MKHVMSVVLFAALIFYGGLAEGQDVLRVFDAAVTPNPARPGEMVLITCRVAHIKGPTFIELVAASASQGDWNVSYPMLYDDGSNGDKKAGDGVYSKAVPASKVEGDETFVFIAVDKDNTEVESEPITLTVKK